MTGFFKKAFEDMKESAAKQHEIDKANFDAVKADSKERMEAAKNFKAEDMAEFKEADGFVEKAKVVMSHMERDGKEIAEKNREEYAKMLEEQRQHMNDTINGNK